MMNNKYSKFGLIGLIIIVGLGGFMFYRSNSSSPDTSTENPADTNSVEENPSESSDDQPGTDKPSSIQVQPDSQPLNPITVEGGSFKFTPNEITVKKGQPVKIVLESKDLMHDFVIDELNVKSTQAKAGESVEVTFTPTQTGSFEFYCSVGNHRAMGMKGTLIVE